MIQTTAKKPSRVSLRSPFFLPAVGVFACIVAFAALLAVLSPAPPRTVKMATGAQGSAYAEFGERYRELLARNNVTLELIATNGAVDNIRVLGDASSGVSVAFVQGGIADAAQVPELVSLGTVFYEPVWFFSAAICRARLSTCSPDGAYPSAPRAAGRASSPPT